MTCLLCPKIWPKLLGWVLSEKLGGGVRHASWNPYPISDQNLWFSLPYFRPDHKFDTLFQTWSPKARRKTNCYGTYTVGVNVKREMVLSPNEEEVASSKKHTQFKNRSAQTTPYFRPKWSKLIPYFRPKRLKKLNFWRRTYLYSLYKGLPALPPRGRKTLYRS